jgi:ABC-type nickel/cobalt efflux system permease component RcnA
MFVLILVVLLYVFVDFGGSFVKINKNIQKNHQNQQKHTKDTPKSTQTYKRHTKINRNIQKTHQNQHNDFGGSFACFC